MGGQAMHLVMVFVIVGVLFNLVSRPASWGQFLSGTFGSLIGVSSGLAKIGT